MLNAGQLLAECAQLLINIVIDWPATSQFGHHFGQMLCTLTLAGRAGAKQKEVRIVRLNHYQDYTILIFTAVVAADMKLNGNASDCNKHIPVFTYSMS